MAQVVRDVMTTNPATLSPDGTVMDAARLMRDSGIGDVLVVDNGGLSGIVTDRDIVVRVIAEGKDPSTTRVGDVCSGDLAVVSLEDPLDRAVTIVRERRVRRIPVVDGGRPVGVLSIGDLAIELDERSALADVSAAPPNG